MSRLRKELVELKLECDLHKKMCGVPQEDFLRGIFCEGVAVKYAPINSLRQQYPIATMCRLLQVSESGYHAWHQRTPSPREQANSRITVEIKAAHERTRHTYGPERLQAELADHGIVAGRHRIKPIRRQLTSLIEST